MDEFTLADRCFVGPLRAVKLVWSPPVMPGWVDRLRDTWHVVAVRMRVVHAVPGARCPAVVRVTCGTR